MVRDKADVGVVDWTQAASLHPAVTRDLTRSRQGPHAERPPAARAKVYDGGKSPFNPP